MERVFLGSANSAAVRAGQRRGPRQPPHFSLRATAGGGGGGGSGDEDGGGGTGVRTRTHGGTTSSCFSTNDLTISSSIQEGR